LKLGIVSDLHCNIDGLDRALESMGPIDALLCLGDSIYEYSFSNAVIGRLRELDALTILGNHEEIFLGAAGVRARSQADIDRPLLGWLAERPDRHAGCASPVHGFGHGHRLLGKQADEASGALA